MHDDFDDVVAGGEEGEGEVPAAPEKPKKDADSVSLSRKEHDALMRRIGELEERDRYWEEQRRKPAADDEEEDPVDDDAADDEDSDVEDEDPEKLSDELAAKGLAALRKRGVITKRELKAILAKNAEASRRTIERTVRETVARTTKALTKDAELLAAHPDLKDPKSEFTQRTGELFKELMADEPEMPKTVALRTAAKLTAAEFRAQERDRESRIRAQSGGRSRTPSYEEGDDAEDLGPNAASLIQSFGRHYGVTLDEMRKYSDRGKGRR